MTSPLHVPNCAPANSIVPAKRRLIRRRRPARDIRSACPNFSMISSMAPATSADRPARDIGGPVPSTPVPSGVAWRSRWQRVRARSSLRTAGRSASRRAFSCLPRRRSRHFFPLMSGALRRLKRRGELSPRAPHLERQFMWHALSRRHGRNGSRPPSSSATDRPGAPAGAVGATDSSGHGHAPGLRTSNGATGTERARSWESSRSRPPARSRPPRGRGIRRPARASLRSGTGW